MASIFFQNRISFRINVMFLKHHAAAQHDAFGSLLSTKVKWTVLKNKSSVHAKFT